MRIKDMRLIAPSGWAKVLVPVYIILAVMFLQSFINGQAEGWVKKTEKPTANIFSVDVGADNKPFADALAKDSTLSVPPRADYSWISETEFIMRQANGEETKAPEVIISAPAGVQNVPDKLPPAPAYNVSSIFIGKVRRFAVINDKIAKIGDKLDNFIKSIISSKMPTRPF